MIDAGVHGFTVPWAHRQEYVTGWPDHCPAPQLT